ncbi:ABC transporter permease [Fulvivirgaceae bacterium BMA10]|uniref:ABC transporter permease n=1 Tax=Splendidivirga corallicola TaxID=3051826 RepID=A0ABT8KRF6_9BACT|nr:ABC transporter permease [Fulvivirgaceae bacterium BMA10]
MLRNYLKTAFRNLWRNKLFSFINISGLTIGITCCLSIYLFVQHEMSYDRFHENADNIYRVYVDGKQGDYEFEIPRVGWPVGPTMKTEFPKIEMVVRVDPKGPLKMECNGQVFRDDLAEVDPDFFELFTFSLIKGDPRTVLEEPGSVVITEKVAKKYFGDDDPMDKLIILENEEQLKVTGICEEIPSNAHFHYDVFTSLAGKDLGEWWMSARVPTYLLLHPDAEPGVLEDKFQILQEKYIAKEVKAYFDQSLGEYHKRGNRYNFHLQGLTSIHLYSNMMSEMEANGDIQYIYIFSSVALLILLIACINFMNISTARSSTRSKEVGVRKVTGASKKHLIAQFMIESMIVALIGLLLAILLVDITIPLLNDISGQTLNRDFLYQRNTISLLVLVWILVGGVSGVYPAFFLSAFNPVTVLKGKLRLGVRSGTLRSILVILQFGISILLMIGTLIIQRQLNFIQNINLGFDKEQVLVIDETSRLGINKVPLFKEDLLTNANISKVSISGSLPFESYGNSVFKAEGAAESDSKLMNLMNADKDFMNTLGFEVISGRGFSKEHATDSMSVLLNESAASAFGWTSETALGKQVGWRDQFTVIGVTKDFHYESLKEHIAPLLIFSYPKLSREHFYSKVCVRIENTTDLKEVMNVVERTWENYANGEPLNYYFMDDYFNDVYKSEQTLGKLFRFFTALAIFVACLGLFGLVSFTTEQRIKEIGIRKVLGASITKLIMLVSKDFARLVLLAMIIASPIAYYIMNRWLQDFAYQTSISWWIFLTAGFTALTLAMVTVGFLAFKAAIANPVNSLRSE